MCALGNQARETHVRVSVSEAVLAIDMSKSKKGRLPSFTELCDGKVGLIRTSCIYFGELKLCLTAVFFFFAQT